MKRLGYVNAHDSVLGKGVSPEGLPFDTGLDFRFFGNDIMPAQAGIQKKKPSELRASFSCVLALVTILFALPTQAATLTATKTVAGSFTPGSAVTYTVVITNTGPGNQADNPGNEFTDTLSSSLFSAQANATSGTVAVSGVFSPTVTWNGALAVNASVTITITVQIINSLQSPEFTGIMISNQGTLAFDADDNGTNEASGVTDDPTVTGASDPTVFTVGSFSTPSRPAATLLLPYFEVDAIPNFPAGAFDPGAPLNTVFTVGNANANAALTRVTVWTDYGIPTLSFHLYLTGYDTETVDLRELFDGVLPRSADANDDPADTISSQGSFSQPDVSFPNCNAAFSSVRLPSDDIIGLRNAHTGQASSLFGNQCASRNHGDGILRGYVTVDVVNACDDTLLPNEAGYAALLQNSNQLWGSYTITDSSNNFSDSGTLVHIEAREQSQNAIPFYRRFNSDTSREPLGSIWATRYLNGGAFSGGTALRVWREPRSTPAPVSCGTPAPAFLPGGQNQIVAFDEQENPLQLTPGSDPGIAVNPFGLVTQEVRTVAPTLALPFNFGWLALNLNHGADTNPASVAQSYVVSAHQADGRFSASIDAVLLASVGANSTYQAPSNQGVLLQGAKTVAGSFTIGSTVTYTVVLTNTGAQTQPNDPNVDEFFDLLPGELTLVNATANSGTATPDVPNNVVTWNGSIPANQSVTITITATVNAGTGGQTISNRGFIRFDADGDGFNESQIPTDDPGQPGPFDFTRFTVPSAVQLQATKTVTGSFTPGGAVTYTVVLTNNGPQAQPDNATDEFTDQLPGGLTLVSTSATSGTAVATVATNLVTWNGSIAANQSVTITITATVNAGQEGHTISNQGIAFVDANNNGTNSLQVRTDDPNLPGTTDPTSFSIPPLVQLQATKTVTGSFVPNGTVTYTVVLTNLGPQTQPDNPTDEFRDFLPLPIVSATATSGTTTAHADGQVIWNGSIAANQSVTITITATLDSSIRPNRQISNQGEAFPDVNLDGTNDSFARVRTDDPTTPTPNDPTVFTTQ